MSKPILGYWDIRGYAQQQRLLLTYLGVDFEDKLYGFGSGPEPSNESWLADKFNLDLDFPNVPYLIDGEVRLTESKAIHKYLARTKGNGVLFPKTVEGQAVAEMVEGVANDLQRALVTLAYSATGIPEKPLQEAQADKFKQLDTFLSKRKWTVGDDLSYVDFYVYEVLKEFVKFEGDFLKPYSALTSFLENFEALPQLTEYIKASDKLLCYSPYAILQF